MVEFFKRWQFDPKRLRISSKERLLFTKRISLYLHAGIPILEALDLIYAMPGSTNHKRLLESVIQDVQAGLPLSHSLMQFSRAYSLAHIQFITVGEASGTLSVSLSSLARVLEADIERRRSIISALAYPFILLVGSLGTSLFLLVYAFPKIIPILRGLHAQLPFTTRTLIQLSTFIQTHWFLLLSIGFVCAIAPSLLFRISSIKKHLDMIMLRLPLAGKLIRMVTAVSIFRTISTLLPSGVRLDEALRMAESGISNTSYRAALGNIRRDVRSGTKFSTALSTESTLFPPVSLQLISAGEMTGTLSESTSAIAHILEEELADGLRLLSSLAEPAIMISMGLVIGFIALAIVSPMYGITQSLGV